MPKCKHIYIMFKIQVITLFFLYSVIKLSFKIIRLFFFTAKIKNN